MAQDNKTRLVMLASELKIMKKVPEGSFDRIKDMIPPEVWTNRSFARRWLLSGGTVPVRQRKERVPRESKPKTELTKRQEREIERACKDAARDYVGDRMSDCERLGEELELDELADCAHDLADAILFDYGDVIRLRYRDRYADSVYDAMESIFPKGNK